MSFELIQVSDLDFSQWQHHPEYELNTAYLKEQGVSVIDKVNIFDSAGDPDVGCVLIGGLRACPDAAVKQLNWSHHAVITGAAIGCLSERFPNADLLFLQSYQDEQPSYNGTEFLMICGWYADVLPGAVKTYHQQYTAPPHQTRCEGKDLYIYGFFRKIDHVYHRGAMISAAGTVGLCLERGQKVHFMAEGACNLSRSTVQHLKTNLAQVVDPTEPPHRDKRKNPATGDMETYQECLQFWMTQERQDPTVSVHEIAAEMWRRRFAQSFEDAGARTQ